MNVTRLVLLVCFVMLPSTVFAQTAPGIAPDVFMRNEVLDRFIRAGEGWDSTLRIFAFYFLEALLTLGFVWQFSLMMMENRGWRDLISELAKFALIASFMSFLVGGFAKEFVLLFVGSIHEMAAATGGGPQQGQVLSGNIAGLGWQIFEDVRDSAGSDVLFGFGPMTIPLVLTKLVLTIGVMVFFLAIAIEIVLLEVQLTLFAYFGSLLIGLGGIKFLRGAPIGFATSAIELGLKLLVLLLVVGVGEATFRDLLAVSSTSLPDLLMLFVAGVTLWMLSKTLPMTVAGCLGRVAGTSSFSSVLALGQGAAASSAAASKAVIGAGVKGATVGAGYAAGVGALGSAFDNASLRGFEAMNAARRRIRNRFGEGPSGDKG